MEVVVVLLSVVVTITNIQVEARSFDNEIEKSYTKDGMDSEEKPNEIIFKLPTKVEHGFSLTIRGTLQLNQSRFTAEFPDTNIGVSEYCRFTYNMTSEHSLIIEASPPYSAAIPQTEVDEEPYIFFSSDEEVPETVEFVLSIEADKRNDIQRFILTFNANGAGDKTVYCGVKNFEDFDHIVIKEGFQKINSLLFEFK